MSDAGVVDRRHWPRPAPALLVLLLLWAVLGLGASIGWLPAVVWYAAGVALTALALLDALALSRRPTPHVARQLADSWPIGIERPVALTLDSARAQRLDLFDLYPGGWAMHGLPQRLTLRPGQRSRIEYHLRADARGDFGFDGV